MLVIHDMRVTRLRADVTRNQIVWKRAVKNHAASYPKISAQKTKMDRELTSTEEVLKTIPATMYITVVIANHLLHKS